MQHLSSIWNKIQVYIGKCRSRQNLLFWSEWKKNIARWQSSRKEMWWTEQAVRSWTDDEHSQETTLLKWKACADDEDNIKMLYSQEIKAMARDSTEAFWYAVIELVVYNKQKKKKKRQGCPVSVSFFLLPRNIIWSFSKDGESDKGITPLTHVSQCTWCSMLRHFTS